MALSLTAAVATADLANNNDAIFLYDLLDIILISHVLIGAEL